MVATRGSKGSHATTPSSRASAASESVCPQSLGTCKHCGTTRLFSNSEADLKDISADKRKRGGAATSAQRAEFYGDIKAAPGVWWA